MTKYLKALGLIILFVGYKPAAFTDDSAEINHIKRLLHTQATSWNEGDIEGYMQGYWHNKQLRFISSGGVLKGWQETLDRYNKSYPETKTMGKLSFTITNVEIISASTASVLGEYYLKRENDAPHGYFSLLVKKIEERWQIVQDHTSAAEN